MSIADKLTQIAENEQRVYDAGHSNGMTDGEQDYIEKLIEGCADQKNFLYTFAGPMWNDPVYKKIPIQTLNGTANTTLMYAYSYVTDTRMPIDLSKAKINTQSTFNNAVNLVTINKIIVSKTTNTIGFSGCSKLENITFEGEIGKSLNMSSCTALSVESMKNIISCLANYAGTDEELSYKLTFAEGRWTALEADSTAPDGGTWRDYVFSLGWDT